MPNLIKSSLLCFGFLLFNYSLSAQGEFRFEVSEDYPFGMPDPQMPEAFLAFEPLIGRSQCRSVLRIDQNTWTDTTDMYWTFKYIMNGSAVQDEVLKSDGWFAGSIRQYIPDSGRWFVHYYNSRTPSAILPSWEGNLQQDGKIVLYRDQKAPNGMEGKYKISFYNISEDGFDWLGEWVTKDESFHYPAWKISCVKRPDPLKE